jgi:hypothetical protein
VVAVCLFLFADDLGLGLDSGWDAGCVTCTDVHRSSSPVAEKASWASNGWPAESVRWDSSVRLLSPVPLPSLEEDLDESEDSDSTESWEDLLEAEKLRLSLFMDTAVYVDSGSSQENPIFVC